MSGNSKVIRLHFAPLQPPPLPTVASVNLRQYFLYTLRQTAWLAALCLCMTAQAVPASFEPSVRELALDGARKNSPAGTRIEVQVGSLDPRLVLAPCLRIEPQLPSGIRLWGKTRIALRCTEGPVHWHVYLPVTVKVFARSLVAASDLPIGATLTPGDLREAEVDLTEAPGAAVAARELAVGRTLARPLLAGQALRQTDLRARQWFAAGDTVRLVASGSGYAVAGTGQALMPGVEGQAVRIRTDSGRVVTGQPVAEHRVEVSL